MPARRKLQSMGGREQGQLTGDNRDFFPFRLLPLLLKIIYIDSHCWMF